MSFFYQIGTTQSTSAKKSKVSWVVVKTLAIEHFHS